LLCILHIDWGHNVSGASPSVFANRLIVLAGEITRVVFQVRLANTPSAIAQAGEKVKELADCLRQVHVDMEIQDWSKLLDDKSVLDQSLESHKSSLNKVTDALDDKNYDGRRLRAIRKQLDW